MNYTPGQILNNKQEYKDFANWTAVHPEAKLSARALGNYTYEIYNNVSIKNICTIGYSEKT